MSSKKAAEPKLSAEERMKRLGGAATSGLVAAAAVMESFQGNVTGKEVDFEAIYPSLEERAAKIHAGNLEQVEGMLFSQAMALQSMFASLARRAAHQEQLKQYGTIMGLAFKAQAQSRATLEALVELKQPRQSATFVKQANIAQGHQQVNNTYAPASGHSTSRTENLAAEPNKLLEEHRGNHLDTGAQGQAGRGHQDLETVEAVHRPAKP